MLGFKKDQMVWLVAMLLLAITINPILKAFGLLPADVFRSLGILFPGLPQIVFGPLIALISLVCFMKTGNWLVFPIIGIARALSLSLVFPANIEHGGTGVAGIVAGFVAAYLLRDAGQVQLGRWLPALAGLYAGLYVLGNYATTLMFGPAAQTSIILGSLQIPLLILLGSIAISMLLAAAATRTVRLTAR